MTRIFDDPTDDMPDLARTVDRRLLAVIVLTVAAWVVPLYVAYRAGYQHGTFEAAPIVCGDSVTVRVVPTVWPRGPVAGARP